MSEASEVSHPSLKQFKTALDGRKVGRALMETFDRWRSNPSKCAPDSELKAAADALWARFQTEMGGQPTAPSGVGQNPTPKPTETRRPGRGQGDRGDRGRR